MGKKLTDVGFVYFFDWSEALEVLSGEEFKALMLATAAYAQSGEAPDDLSPLAKMAFSFIAPSIDRWHEKSDARAESGRKGGLARTGKADTDDDKQVEADGSKDKQSEADGSKDKQSEADDSKDKQSEADASYYPHPDPNSHPDLYPYPHPHPHPTGARAGARAGGGGRGGEKQEKEKEKGIAQNKSTAPERSAYAYG